MTNELVPSTMLVLPAEQRGKKPGRFSLVFGLVAIAVVVVAAVAVLTRSDGEDSSLFVLPAPADEWQLTNGAIADPNDDVPGTAQQFIFRGLLFGVADGDGFADLRSQTFYSDSPLTGTTWDAIELSENGDTLQRADDSITLARPNDDGSWQVVSSPDDLIHALGLLTNDIRPNMVTVAAFSPPNEPSAPATSFDMTSSDGTTFTVETSASNSPLFDVATFAERVEPIDINGVPGWVISDELADGTETSVAWSPESGGTVIVRSTSSPAAVIAAAQLLNVVPDDDWMAVFPNAAAD